MRLQKSFYGIVLFLPFAFFACNKSDVPKPAAEQKSKVVAPEPKAPKEKPRPKQDSKPATTPKDPNELRVEHRDGGIFIVNSAQKGKIIHSDGGVVLVLKEEPSQEPVPSPQAITQPDPKPITKSDHKNDLAEKIQDYFFTMDNFQVGPTGVKPRKFAEKLLANMARNKTEEFDKLKSGMEKTKDKMRAIQPPEPCAEYHTLSIALLDDSMDMMESLADAIKSGNKSELNALVGRASALKTKTKKLEKLRASIEKRYLSAPQ